MIPRMKRKTRRTVGDLTPEERKLYDEWMNAPTFSWPIKPEEWEKVGEMIGKSLLQAELILEKRKGKKPH